MNPPHNKRAPQYLLVKFSIFFLFFITASSLLGSRPGEFISLIDEEASGNKTIPENLGTVTERRTEQNRRLSDQNDSDNESDPTQERRDYFDLKINEGSNDEFTFLPSRPLTPQRPVSVSSRRLSGLLPNPSTGLDEAEPKETELKTGDFAKAVIATTGVRKAARKWRQVLSSNYKPFTTLDAENQNTQKRRSEISTQSAIVEIQAKKTREFLQENFFKKRQMALQERAALNLARGIPPFCHPPKATLAALDEKYSQQKLMADLSTQLALYHSDYEFLVSYLSKRCALLPDEEGSEDPFRSLNKEAYQALQSVQQAGIDLIQKIIPDFQTTGEANSQTVANLDSLTPEKIVYLQQTLTLIRETQLFVLGCHTSTYITTSKNKLDEIEAYLIADTPIKKKSISESVREQYAESKKLLSESKALFSLKETIPTAATIQAAKESTATIQDQLVEIEKSKTALRAARERAENPSISTLRDEGDVMEQLQSCFQDAALVYDAIQDEAEIEKACGSLPDLKKKIQECSSSVASQAALLLIVEKPEIDSLLSQLTAPLTQPVFALDEADLVPQHPLLFLDHLKNSEESLNKQYIIDTHGKIGFLDSLPAKTNGIYPIKMKRLWVSGIDTIREGLRQGWGLHIVQQFDKEHDPFIRHGIALQISDLKNFLFDQGGNLKYARSFFIPLEMAHKKFLEELSTNKADHVIKVDAATLAFNPFDKKPLAPTRETIAAAELRQRQAGFEYTRKALKLAFPETSLSAEHWERILERFDDQFKVSTLINEKVPLTLQAAADFIDIQKEILSRRNCWEKYLSRYFDREATRHISLGFFYNIGTHLGTAMIILLSYLYYHSLTHTLS